MVCIGICDDSEQDRDFLLNICNQYYKDGQLECIIQIFKSGEEVLAYCEQVENPRIDILFLDIEMSGIDGIETKEKILRNDRVWRIVFVSSHQERVFESFGLKTMGFVIKPAERGKIEKWLRAICEELEEDIYIELKGSYKSVRLEDIAYVEANRNYAEVYLHPVQGAEPEHILLSKKIGDLEKEWCQYPMVRVHKSYLVNLMNITAVNHTISMRDMKKEIPVGRTYRDKVHKRYQEYGKEKVRRRL